jgi:hypothetical protein
MNDFLPKDYNVPDNGGNYMKFQPGENRFRVLASPILGYVYWTTDATGGRKPNRIRMSERVPANVILADDDDPKHFWAMPVWNYQDEQVQILEITQKGLMKSIRQLAADADWGSPVNYDLVVTKSGQKLETKYSLQPKPAKPLDEGITRAFTDMHINLDALYDGKDPFAGDVIEVDPDEADKALGGK